MLAPEPRAWDWTGRSGELGGCARRRWRAPGILKAVFHPFHGLASAIRASCISVCLLFTTSAQAADAASWMMPELLPAARAEGALTVYSSVNEQEGLPLWKMFEEATGIAVSYVRASDSVILSRVAIEH